MQLWANYFEVGKVKDIVLHQHLVKVTPTETAARRRRRIFTLLLNHPELVKLPIATNYIDQLICTRTIQSKGTLDLDYYEEEEDAADSRKKYTVEIKLNKKFSLAELVTDLASTHDTYPDKAEAVQALNIVLAAFPNVSPGI